MVAVSAALFWLGLHTPSTSASRTATSPSKWNLALKPLPTIPIPSRFVIQSSYWTPSFGRAARALVFRDDEIREHPDGLPFVRREERRREGHFRRDRFLRQLCRPCRLCRRPFERRGQRGHRHRANCFAPLHRALFFNWSAI